MSSQQFQMASVPIEPNSLFKPLMWNDSIDTSYWRKPLVDGNYVQHLSLLVEFFFILFILLSFFMWEGKNKVRSNTSIEQSDRVHSNVQGWEDSALICSEKPPCLFPYTGIIVDACVS